MVMESSTVRIWRFCFPSGESDHQRLVMSYNPRARFMPGARRRGGIGIRGGFKIRCRQRIEGASPSVATLEIEYDEHLVRVMFILTEVSNNIPVCWYSRNT